MYARTLCGLLLIAEEVAVVRLISQTSDGQPVTGMLVLTAFPHLTLVDVQVRALRHTVRRPGPPLNRPLP